MVITDRMPGLGGVAGGTGCRVVISRGAVAACTVIKGVGETSVFPGIHGVTGETIRAIVIFRFDMAGGAGGGRIVVKITLIPIDRVMTGRTIAVIMVSGFVIRMAVITICILAVINLDG